MFTKPVDATKPRTWKWKVFGALAGAAAVALGTQLFDTFEAHDSKSIEALEMYTNTLIDHQEYSANQVVVLEELIGEGLGEMHNTKNKVQDAVEAYLMIAKKETKITK